uniref:Paneth cell-specific alpha-defensin 18 n=1 Tax=Equus caballus TaxID=9796 RepID=C8BNH1_HORSE|nr:Paneth cell-specific alpha-defensin 18 precursor [Equus caballus]XP_008527863.1 PREDICTED: neutrophil antibiotic peptide NP-2-like [Equus przewalskii]ACV49744.1 Paneth cell-specific alpha-defensin 18 [Equus caballus]
MRTLALLAALLLLVLQAQTQKSEKAADQVPAQDQPEAEFQEVIISFGGNERSAQNETALQEASTCRCRVFCHFRERRSGTCAGRGIQNRLCCPRRPPNRFRPTVAQDFI